MLKVSNPRWFVTFLLVFGLLLSTTAFIGQVAKAESWTDDFTGTDLDPRWTRGGASGVAIVDGDTYLMPASFTGESNVTWYGPYVRTTLSVTGTFNITTVLKCKAETTEYNLARAEVRLFDTSGDQVYAFGWADASMSDNKASIYLNGASDSAVLYSTGEDFAYSIFLDKSVGLERTDSQLRFYVEDNLLFTTSPSPKPIGYLELGFLRYKEYPTYCTPEIINFNSIAVDTSPPTVPDTPSNLVCQGGEGQVDLSWSAPSNGGLQITSYRIFRGTASGDLQHLTTIGNELTYNDKGVLNGQQYFYAVSAVNEMGESGLSSETNAIPLTIPGAPENLQALSGNAYVNLTWAPPASNGGSQVINYKVFRGDGPSTLTLLDTLGFVYYFNDTGLTNDQTYYYALSAVNAVGEGIRSNEVAAIPGSSTTTPSEPRNPVAVAGDGQVTLRWSAPLSNGNSRIINYTVHRGTTPQTIQAFVTLGDALTYLDTSLSNGQTYHYQVGAVNVIGAGPLSETVSAMPIETSPPSEPLSVRATPFDGQILLQWDEPASDGGVPITGYRVYRGNDTCELLEVATLGTVLSYMDTGLVNGMTYHFGIAAINDEGEGPISESVIEMPVGANMGGDGGDENTTNPGNDWSLTSSVVTIIILAITGLIAMLYLRRPGSSK